MFVDGHLCDMFVGVALTSHVLEQPTSIDPPSRGASVLTELGLGCGNARSSR